VERHFERDLEILTAIGEGRPLSQRALAARLGVALGLTNLLLKRLARKGYIKIVEFPKKPAARKRLRYLLTSKGFSEKTRLTYEHMTYSLHVYRRARQTLRESLADVSARGMKRIALFGTGEPAELAYLTLRELGLEPFGVFSASPDGDFLGFPVRAATELAHAEFDALVLATFERPEPEIAHLVQLNVPKDKIVTLRSPAVGHDANGGPRSQETDRGVSG
jgi:DNA-binding MarR family transcriptional regulator